MATNRTVSAAQRTPQLGRGHTATGAQNSDTSPQILVDTGKNFVIDSADFGTQTEKGCPPLVYTVQSYKFTLSKLSNIPQRTSNLQTIFSEVLTIGFPIQFKVIC